MHINTKLWDSLRGKKSHMRQFLDEVRLKEIRGIKDLAVSFGYPVCVIAGGNATGKSTVLFAAACAYRVTSAGPRSFVPSSLFPTHRSKAGGRQDEQSAITLEYEYSTPKGRVSMRWRRGKSWNRSFFGRKGGKQPERLVYLRTLSNLANPSEVRGILRMSHTKASLQERPLNAAQIEFAQQIVMLPQYKEVVKLSGTSHKDKDLLFAVQANGAEYSELNMSAGERAVLRLSQSIAQMKDALILIDEVEAGLHPLVQQLLMRHLQQLALRNDLQIIVTSHSSAVIDSVPREARIFLERSQEDGKVHNLPPHRDIIQNALYGLSSHVLNVLCEDEAAENILHGVFEKILPSAKITPQSIRVGRDTGAQEFPSHVAAFRKFGLLDNFVFILDGDQRTKDVEEKLIARAGERSLSIAYLPSDCSPEQWIWECLKREGYPYAGKLGTDAGNFAATIKKFDALYAQASDSGAEIAKNKLMNLASELNTDSADICRKISRLEAEDDNSTIQPLVSELTDMLQRWRDGG